jgi:hypothetical protein
MASGSQITLNFGGNSLVDVTISKGTLNALVSNKRAIIANGGQVIMTAKAADQVLSAQVNNSGIVQARTMAALKGGSGTQVARKGSIKLLADGGTVKVSGKLDASAPKGGDGGFIETSGNKVTIADNAVITTKSSTGQNGTWLIDPDGFTIAATGGDITGTLLSSQLASNNVTIASTSGSGTGGNLDVNDTVTWLANTVLTLNATKAINVNAVISGANGGLVLNAGTDINVNAPSSVQVATLSAAATGDVNINAPQTWTNNGNWIFSGTNINVNDAVNWSAGTLTLNAGAAGGFINLNAAMTASGTAKLVATYNTGMDTSTEDVTDLNGVVFTQPTATYGTPFGGINPLFDPAKGTFVGKIDFVNNTAASPLRINGDSYTLITSMNQLASLSTVLRNADGTIATDPNTGDPISYTVASGYYALAKDLDASGNTYPGAVIYQLTGTLEGLGHTISNLKIAPPAVPDTVHGGYMIDGNLGLIGTVGTFNAGYGSGTVRDIGIVSVQISDTVTTVSGVGSDGGSAVGPLAASNYGTIRNAFATGNPNAPVPVGSPYDGTPHADGTSYPAVTAAVAAAYEVGGLVGRNYGLIANSHADVSVYGTSYVGGLVGWNQRGSSCCGNTFGVILNSYATGTVSAGNNAFSTGGWIGSAEIGGFVGYNSGGVISNSYATGPIWALNSINIGGFAGSNTGYSALGTLNNVSSSGTVYIGWSASQGYGQTAGGLVGNNEGLVNGGYTSSNIVAATVFNADYGFNLLFEGIGAAFGNQAGIANGTTATGKITYNNDDGPTQQNYTGGWDFGGTTNPIYNPGAGGTPPQESGSRTAQQAAVQRAADARAQAEVMTQRATAQQVAVAQAAAAQAKAAAAAIRQGVAAANVSATNAAVSAATPPSSTIANAGTGATAAAGPSNIQDNLKTIENNIKAQEQRERRRTAAATARPRGNTQRDGNFGATIRTIDVDGQRFNLRKDAPKQDAPAQPGR